MIEVYLFLPSSEIDDVIECGLKLSRWSDREVRFDGEMRKCIAALLNPKDDMEKYNSAEYSCAKLQVDPADCRIAERYYYLLGLENSAFMQMYRSGILPVREYVFGSYRLPECLVTTTVLSEQLSKLDRRLDSPVLYDNSEELFLNNLLGLLGENGKESVDALLYCYFDTLAQNEAGGIIKRVGDDVDVFIDKRNVRAYPLRRPEWVSGNPSDKHDD